MSDAIGASGGDVGIHDQLRRGGSLTILSATPNAKAALEQRVEALDPSYRVLPIQVSSVGLQVGGTR
jgi:hypothetical protein